MAVTSKIIHIEAPTSKVFNYLAEIQKHVEWSGELSFGLERVEKVTSGPLGVGSVFRSIGRLSALAGIEDTSTITEIEPGHRLSWETVSRGTRQRHVFRWSYTLESENNSTWLTYTLEMRRFRPMPLHLWFPPLLWLLDRALFGREMEAGLEKIKLALERKVPLTH